MISLQNITKRFGSKVAVNDVSLDIPEGEFFAVLGPNGAGKTTTIKMMVGLLNPTAGRIVIGGCDISSQYLKAKELLSYVPDEPYLYDKLSGLEFLHFIADMYGINGTQKEKSVSELVELFSMGDYIRELTESYSHGMKQRVVLSATLLHNPKVMVIDEPIVGLDPQTSRLVRDIFRERAKNGTTIFMSTHIVSLAQDVADRIGIMANGKIVACGTVDELRKSVGGNGSLEDTFFKIIDNAGHKV